MMPAALARAISVNRRTMRTAQFSDRPAGPMETMSGFQKTTHISPPSGPSGLAPGDYTGSFEILGGANGSAFDTPATTGFQVSPTPEPSTMFLLATSLGLLAFVTYRKGQISPACNVSSLK